MTTTHRIAGGLALLAGSLLLVGCVSVQLGAPVPSMDSIASVRAAGLPPMDVGRFSLQPGADPSIDGPVGMRAAMVGAPKGSNADYLRETLIVELRSAGIYSPGAPIEIQGFLTGREVDPAISEGTGRLSARFVVTTQGKQVLDKSIEVSSRWSSSFVGVSAISAAMNEYSQLYRKLANALLADPQFVAAVKGN